MLINTANQNLGCGQPGLLVPHEKTPVIFGVYKNGSTKCRFDMFARWPAGARRQINPFLYRGDRFNVTQPDQMLKNHIKNFTKQYKSFSTCIIWDNTRPDTDPEREVLKWNDGKIEQSLLKNYAIMLEGFYIPEWMIK